nr:hypothetical protein Iba_chr05cCG10500 [Ipomoea batatas]
MKQLRYSSSVPSGCAWRHSSISGGARQWTTWRHSPFRSVSGSRKVEGDEHLFSVGSEKQSKRCKPTQATHHKPPTKHPQASIPSSGRDSEELVNGQQASSDNLEAPVVDRGSRHQCGCAWRHSSISGGARQWTTWRHSPFRSVSGSSKVEGDEHLFSVGSEKQSKRCKPTVLSLPSLLPYGSVESGRQTM